MCMESVMFASKLGFIIEHFTSHMTFQRKNQRESQALNNSHCFSISLDLG